MGIATKEPGDSGWYEVIVQILYSVKGKRLADVARVNDLLRKFRRLLEGQKIIDGTTRIHVQTVGEFVSQKMDLMTLNCSNQIKLEIVDDEKTWAYNRTHKIEPRLHNHFRSLSLDNRLRGDEKLTISVIDSTFGGDGGKDSRCPKEDLYRSLI